jgi:hypothetical protein
MLGMVNPFETQNELEKHIVASADQSPSKHTNYLRKLEQKFNK